MFFLSTGRVFVELISVWRELKFSLSLGHDATGALISEFNLIIFFIPTMRAGVGKINILSLNF